jgi:hypothetical protein
MCLYTLKTYLNPVGCVLYVCVLYIYVFYIYVLYICVLYIYVLYIYVLYICVLYRRHGRRPRGCWPWMWRRKDFLYVHIHTYMHTYIQIADTEGPVGADLGCGGGNTSCPADAAGFRRVRTRKGVMYVCCMYVCVCVCVYIYIYVCVLCMYYICICIYYITLYMYIILCVYMTYIYTHKCKIGMHTDTHTHTHTHKHKTHKKTNTHTLTLTLTHTHTHTQVIRAHPPVLALSCSRQIRSFSFLYNIYLVHTHVRPSFPWAVPAKLGGLSLSSVSWYRPLKGPIVQ